MAREAVVWLCYVIPGVNEGREYGNTNRLIGGPRSLAMAVPV